MISTHTLTWSVTVAEIYVGNRKGISTHTLTWSVTAMHKDIEHIKIFQLTRSRGA